MNPVFIQAVYDTVCGHLEAEFRVPGVPELFAPGTACDRLYEQAMQAVQRLCSRLGTEAEDADVEVIINSLLEITHQVGLEMFICGSKFPTMNSNDT